MISPRLRRLLFAAAAAFLGAAAPASADRKFYLFTYQYATLPKGAAELETWITREDDDTVPKQIDGQLQIEGEFGITDRFDISLYTILEKEGSESLDWDASKIEMKYRLGEPGKWPADVELYAEYEQPFQVHGWG